MLYRVLKFRPDNGDGGGSGGGTGDGPTITVTVDGKEVTVPRPKGLITDSEYGERFSKELNRRTASIAQKALDDLFSKPDELAKFAEKHGVKLVDGSAGRGDDGKPKPEQIAELRKSVEKELVEPLKGKLSATEKELATMREKSLLGDITAVATDLGVKKSLRTRPANGGLPPIVAMFRDNFGYDPESGGWYVKKGDGFAFSSNPTDDSPYKTPAEFFAELAANKEYADFFDGGAGQGGPGAKPGSQTRVTGGEVRISRADASIRSKWQDAQKKAAAQGGRVVIVD